MLVAKYMGPRTMARARINAAILENVVRSVRVMLA